jgi:hypothetical protein
MKAKPLSHPPDPAVKDRERGAVTREVAQRAPREWRGSTAQPRGPPDDYEALAAKLADAIAEALSKETDAFGVAGFCRRHGLSPHHLTYAHLGDELLFELISVCDDCHARLHTAKTEIGR